MNEVFKPVSSENIPKLFKYLETQLPKTAMIYNITKCYLEDNFSENIATQLFSLNDDFDEKNSNTANFIFAVQLRKKHKSLTQLVTLLAPENPSKEMLIAFEASIDWTCPVAFASVDACFVGFIKEMCERQGKVSASNQCFALAMMIPKAVSLSIGTLPDSVSVRELTENCAEKVTSRWKFSEEGTLEVMRDAISTMCSAGVFIESELVSWVVMSSYGSIMSLYTEDEHRRKGYAELTMKFCMKLAGERGFLPNVQVEFPNLISKKLMEKCGLEYLNDVEWVIYKPHF